MPLLMVPPPDNVWQPYKTALVDFWRADEFADHTSSLMADVLQVASKALLSMLEDALTKYVWSSQIDVATTRDLVMVHAPVNMLTSDALLSGGPLGSIVTPAGYRILASSKDLTAWLGKGNDSISCDLMVPRSAGAAPAIFCNYSKGAGPAAEIARIFQAGRMLLPHTANFTLNILAMPSIQVEALQLVSATPGGDLILPVLSADPLLSTTLTAPLQEAEFLALARQILNARPPFIMDRMTPDPEPSTTA